ncbi:MAG: amidohydrolase family protein, partial [bacterium]|nr:amidohydrolase family protein [bacterium]
RFNLKRGGSEGIKHLERLAKRVYDIARWHVELYVDSGELAGMYHLIKDLSSVSIDHLGLSKTGFDVLLKLVAQGVRVKATGFGRVDFDVPEAVKEICNVNPNFLMFGTDLPSTRAPRPYNDNDLLLIIETLGEESAKKVLVENAVSFYRP